MKKTKDITKYNLKWQIIRSNIKGPSISLHSKIKAVSDYFNSEKTIDAYERVLNYLEGLQMGYIGKNQKAVDQIEQEIYKYREMNTSEMLKEPNGFITFNDAIKYSFKDRYNLWKDLFIRNRKWLKNGYIQKEINDFMDILYRLFQQNQEIIDKSYSYETLEQLRMDASKKTNTHKFFF
ncbi:MAG: hypothetical protein WC905_02955 [Patescibacteria group bacterium]|jgi:hypothetical protein